MDANGQARVGRVGRSVGVPNYRNDILINVVEEYLPQGLEGWRGVALAYQRESMETVLRRGEETTGPAESSATACRSRQVSPVS